MRTGSRSASTHSAERLRVEHAVHGREEHAGHLRAQLLPREHFAGVVVVDAVANHELHFVVRPQPREVAGVVLRRFPAARTLHVHDHGGVGRHVFDAAVATGLDQHLHAGGVQAVHQRIDVLLQQRLAAGHLDQIAAVTGDLGHDVVERHLAALVERVGAVAPGAAQVARREAHEHTRPAGVARLALDGIEDLVDRQHAPRARRRRNRLL